MNPTSVPPNAASVNAAPARGMLFLGCSNDGGMLYERATEVVSQIGAA
jgi:hypothetical protein